MDKKLRTNIKNQMQMHGNLSILFYKLEEEWILKKWGEFESLSKIHSELHKKYLLAGFDEEANSLTLLELPKDEDLIFNIITCGSLSTIVKELGLLELSEDEGSFLDYEMDI
jgi:hypothetical protein